MIDVILNNYQGGITPTPYVLWSADLNDDNVIDILDIIILIEQIMDINLNTRRTYELH